MNKRPLIVAFVATASLAACGKPAPPAEPIASRSLVELDAAVKRLEESQGRWVLWRSVTSLDQMQAMIPYFAQDAFGEKVDCAAAAGANVRNALGSSTVAVTDTSYQVTDQSGRRTVYAFVCLPETVDPRKPN